MPNADFSKWLNPQDVAEVALWLADEKSAHLTAAVLSIDGPNA